MSIAKQNPDAFARRINYYVPACQYAAEVSKDGVYRVSLGSPSALDADGILDGVVADDSGPYTYLPASFKASIPGIDDDGVFTDAEFGRCITAVGSAAGVTQNLTVVGYDYLVQKISKTKAMNGTTPIEIAVAFKRIESVTIAVGASGETIDVGFNDNLGLPYVTAKILSEERANVPATLGTLVAPVLTDPQTAATADPRGVLTPNAATGGTEHIITAIASSWVNAAGNGGLYGIAHFAG